MKLGTKLIGSVVIGMIAVNAATSHAASMALDLTGGVFYQRGTFANFGYSFTTSETLSVEQLGLFDPGANGLGDPHEVGLWDSAGNLLAQAVITSSSAATASAFAGHAWRFESITPVQIAPGTYKLGAFYRTTADTFVGSSEAVQAGLQLHSAISYGQAYVTTGGTEFFTEPVSTLNAQFTPGFFGPNMNFTVVPEPSTFALVSLAGLVGLRRRR